MEGRMINKIELYPGQRKTSKAVATIAKGTGKVRMNNRPAELVSPEIARELLLMPLTLIGELRNRIDVDVQVHGGGFMGQAFAGAVAISRALTGQEKGDRKSTRLNSSHANISYAVFCLKKKTKRSIAPLTGTPMLASAVVSSTRT